MINLKVGETKVGLPNSWEELNVSQYAQIIEIFKKHGAIAETDKEKKTKEEFDYDCLKANKEAFVYLTGFDKEQIDKCPANQITSCLKMMTDFLSKVEQKTYKDVDDTVLSFDFKNKTYFYPEFKFRDTTFGDYIETAQLNMLVDKQKGGRFSVLPEQMAIMCKTKTEQKEYDEKTVMKKRKLFEKLPMNIVWDFVFFLMKQTIIWETSFKTFSNQETELVTDTQEKTGT